MTVRRLRAPEDLNIFRALRLEMLRAEPAAYASSYQDAVALSEPEWLGRMQTAPMCALFQGDDPVGLMGYLRERSTKMRHRASLIMVWVRPDARGRGGADRLLAGVLAEAAADGIDQMELTVLSSNARALRFYERNGFEIVGTIPNAVRGPDGDHADHVMARWLKA